ncbi:MAG: restriction endonuclease subunit S [Desulfoprunum sp.]|nr:restriction endonuclease subunit S [Desulfoprunum sp.]
MSDWTTCPLSELAEIRVSNVDKKSMPGEKPAQLCNYMNVYSNAYITASLEFMQSTASAVEREKFKVSSGDVIITKDSETPFDIGIPAVVMDDISELVCGYHLALIKPDKEKVNSVYLSKQLASSSVAKYFSRMAAGSTRYGLSNGAIAATAIPLAPKKLQQKIAAILVTLDQTIKKTEALIHKYQQIKAGLMHDLFTRGLTADGKLRPSRDQAPELYQETLIGWIPKEWGCDQIANLLGPVANNMRSGPFGSALLKAELVEEGVPFLGIDNIHVENFVPIFRRFVSEKKFRELSKYAVKPRDVVITIMGTVGRCALVPNYIDNALSSKHLWAMTFDQEKVVPELICWQLNFAEWVKSWFRRETQGGIMDAIQSKTLKTLRLPIPPPQEQERIFERYNAIKTKIDSERDNLEKLQKQKSGLMHDLLTGKVPVTIEQAEPAHV